MNYDFLLKAFPKSRITEFLPYLEEAFLFADINSIDEICFFFANAAAETAGFTDFEENLWYRAQTLADTWPNRYAVDKNAKVKKPNALANRIQKQPELIANLTYANRMGNGSPESGDGYKYRGRGPGQTTGLDQYMLVDKELNMNGKIVANPDMLLEPYFGLMAYVIQWKHKRMNELLNPVQFKKARIRWNGGTHGLAKVIIPKFNQLKNLMTIAL